MSLPPEILKKVKLLELGTRKLVNNLFAGQYNSAFKGQGMTFSEFREYVPGDDVRNIAWTLTARTGKTYIKQFDEEREMTLMLVVDISGSSDFGSSEYFKGEVITHLSALLGFAAAKKNDQVGLLLFSNQVEHYVPPKKGQGHIHRILRDLYYYKPQSRQTNISVPLEYLQGVLKKRSNIFVFSDFMEGQSLGQTESKQNSEAGFSAALRLLGQKHDVVAVVVQDQAEKELPDIGVVDMQDAETGEIITVDTSSKVFRQNFSNIVQRRSDLCDQQLRKAKVDRVDVDGSADFVDAFIAYFKRRNSR